MSSGTKIFLSIFALLIGAMVLYYTVLTDDTDDPIVVQKAKDPLSEPTKAAIPDEPPAKRIQNVPATPRTTPPSGGTDDLLARTIGGARPAGTGDSTAPPPAEKPRTEPKLTDLPVRKDPDLAKSGDRFGSPPKTVARSTEKKPAEQEVTPPKNESVKLPAATNLTRRADDPAAKRSSTPPAPERTKYTVKSGDTMSSIAGEWFGDVNKWSLIAEANPLVDPDDLQIGDVLFLPSRNATVARKQNAKENGRQIHVVRSGDSLSSIAGRYYGDNTRWEIIFDANEDLLNGNPDEIRVGMKLVIPAKR